MRLSTAAFEMHAVPACAMRRRQRPGLPRPVLILLALRWRPASFAKLQDWACGQRSKIEWRKALWAETSNGPCTVEVNAALRSSAAVAFGRRIRGHQVLNTARGCDRTPQIAPPGECRLCCSTQCGGPTFPDTNGLGSTGAVVCGRVQSCTDRSANSAQDASPSMFAIMQNVPTIRKGVASCELF